MSIRNNLAHIHENINNAVSASEGRTDCVQVVVVSKHHTVEEIMEAYSCGQRVFAENRVQELLPKIEATKNVPDIEWQLIGHLQKNKVRQVVGKVSLIQSVDSIELADEIEKRAEKAGCKVNILLQVNVAEEEQKYGIAFKDIDAFIDNMVSWPHIFLHGFMFIAPNFEDKTDLYPFFDKLYNKFKALSSLPKPRVEMKWLSMGMSGDYEYAITSGANMVRIGSAVFNVE